MPGSCSAVASRTNFSSSSLSGSSSGSSDETSRLKPAERAASASRRAWTSRCTASREALYSTQRSTSSSDSSMVRSCSVSPARVGAGGAARERVVHCARGGGVAESARGNRSGSGGGGAAALTRWRRRSRGGHALRVLVHGERAGGAPGVLCVFIFTMHGLFQSLVTRTR